MIDLVERLETKPPSRHLCLDAAREIERLQAENERLTFEVSNLRLANEEARKTIDHLNTLLPREANDSA